MVESDVSIRALIEAYRQYRPGQVATLLSILKTIAEPLRQLRVIGGKESQDWLEHTPAHRLYALLDGHRAVWERKLAGRLPAGPSYQRAYPRALRRLIVFGEERDLLHPDQFLLTPAWRALLRAAPLTTGDDSDTATARWAFRRLALWATAAGHAPTDLPVQGADGRIMGGFWTTFPAGRDGGFYQARRAWNRMASGDAALGLRPWEADPSDDVPALPLARWPSPVADGLRQLVQRDGLGCWKEETRVGYRLRIASYLGALGEVGIDVAELMAVAATGKDAFRLLFQGMPLHLRGVAAGDLARRLATDAAFAAVLLAEQQQLDGAFDGRAAEDNPFLLAAVRLFGERGRLTTAADLLRKAAAINRGFLGITDRHVGWMAPKVRDLEAMARRKPSVYVRKKRAVFRRPDLWRDLVVARARLREHTLALEAAWGNAKGSSERGRARRWATALRNEVLLGLLLSFPMRVGNVVAMEVGRHYDPATHEISFEAEETKNDKAIDYELPDGGSLGDLRGLVDRYLLEARPILLDGRRSSHFFVPDPRGGVRMRTRAINVILADLSRQFLTGVLPPGIEVLNPHLLRHAAASYHLAIRGDLNLAAQMLNTTQANVSIAYADILESRKEATKRFLSSFEV